MFYELAYIMCMYIFVHDGSCTHALVLNKDASMAHSMPYTYILVGQLDYYSIMYLLRLSFLNQLCISIFFFIIRLIISVTFPEHEVVHVHISNLIFV